MTKLKFIHAADIHLGRPFSGLLRSNPDLGALFRRASVTAWERIVAQALNKKADFLTLAGDVFDSVNPTVHSRIAFRKGVESLRENGIPVFMALGNHDPLATFPHSLISLPGLHVFGPEPSGTWTESVEKTQGVKVYGASFERSVVQANLASRFVRDTGVDLAIGVLHANVAGIGGHRDYAPCVLDDLRTGGMNIWCLGHVHTGGVLCEDPLILYAGTSQGSHAKETGPLGCYLVTVGADGSADAELLPVAPVLWETVELDVTVAEESEEIVDWIESACFELCGRAGTCEALVVRIKLSGNPGARVKGTLDKVDELLDILSEVLPSLPIPVFPESVLDLTGLPMNLKSLRDSDGFGGDFLRVCSSCPADREICSPLLDELRVDLLRKVSPAYLTPEVDPVKLLDDPQALGSLFEEVGTLVSRMLTEGNAG